MVCVANPSNHAHALSEHPETLLELFRFDDALNPVFGHGLIKEKALAFMDRDDFKPPFYRVKIPVLSGLFDYLLNVLDGILRWHHLVLVVRPERDMTSNSN